MANLFFYKLKCDCVIPNYDSNVVDGFAALKQYHKVFDSHEVDVVSKETLGKSAVAQQLLQQPENTTLTAGAFNHQPQVRSQR